MVKRLQPNKTLSVVILSVFVILVLVQWPIFNSAYKGKEKDFNDKLFNVVALYQEHLLRDSALVQTIADSTSAVNFITTRIRHDIDSIFRNNDIPVAFVLAAGKGQRIQWTQGLFWSESPENTEALVQTRLGVYNLGKQGSTMYYAKVLLPRRPTYILKTLLPLMGLSFLALAALLLCFLALMKTIQKQSRLAEIKNDFINNMTHELKTPLFTISIASRMLGEAEAFQMNEKYQSYISSIRHETGRLNNLVEKMLQVSALEQKRLQLDKQKIDIHAVIKQAVDNMQLILSTQGASLQLSLDAGHTTIMADEMHILNILYSLMDNAIKYSDGPAEITISTRNENGRILICVTDKGIGFDIETSAHIFDRFFRAHTGDLHNVKGYGIGLSYVKSVMEAHQGTVSVKSAVGKGSTFTLSLSCINEGA